MKLAGVPVLLDLHEAMPEFFRSRFPRAANPISYRLLLLQEKLSIALANEVLTVNEPLAERLIRLGARPERLTVVLNSPDLRLFDPTAHPRRRFMADGKLRIVYTGALTPTYELDVVLRAVASLARTRPGLRVDATFYGRGDAREHLEALAAELGVADQGQLPRPHPDRGGPGRRRRRGHRRGTHAAGSVYADEPLHEGARVRGHGQARGGIAPAHRGALLRCRHAGGL